MISPGFRPDPSTKNAGEGYTGRAPLAYGSRQGASAGLLPLTARDPSGTVEPPGKTGLTGTVIMASHDQGVLPPVAQTNLGLYKQLQAAGTARAELVWIRDCYEYATSLFAGYLRAYY